MTTFIIVFPAFLNLKSDFNQRTYELTYATELSVPSKSCINGSHTGGSDLMLQWVSGDVIPAVLSESYLSTFYIARIDIHLFGVHL